jgi:serine protease inhibitor
MKWFFLFAVQVILMANWIDDTNQFGNNLYKEIDGDNRVISPLSTRVALLMAYIGASGETENSMRKTLCIRDDVLPPHLAIPSLEMSCSAWLDSRFSILSTFEEAVRGGFDAEVLTTSFLQPDLAASLMNKWINEKSHGKIPSLIEAGSIDPLTRLFLLNTIYYKEKWQSPFDPERTTLKPFYGQSGTQNVKTMSQLGTFLYADDGAQQVVALPFAGNGNMALVISLPRSGKEANPVDIKTLKPTSIHLEVPKFALKKRVDLSSALTKMGMPTAFTSAANFSGMTGDASLKIAKVVTETVLEIDEAGACAAAATAIQMNCKSFITPGVTLSINRPFSVMLIDLETNLKIVIGDVCTL